MKQLMIKPCSLKPWQRLSIARNLPHLRCSRTYGCSYSQVKHFRKEYNAVRRSILRSDREWLLKSKLFTSQQHCYSTENPKNDWKDETKKNKTDEKKTDDFQDDSWMSFLQILTGVGCLFFAFSYFNQVPKARHWLPNHVNFETFETEYLMKGKVKDVAIYGSYEGTGEIALVTLHPSTVPGYSDYRDMENPMRQIREMMVIVDVGGTGQFKELLTKFETQHNVKKSERIHLRHMPGYSPFESIEAYKSNLLKPLWFAMFIFTMLLIRRGNKFFTGKREWERYKTELGKMRDKMGTEKVQEDKAKTSDQARPMREKRNFREELEDGNENENETFADKIRNAFFSDEFKVKRGDKLMKDKISFKEVVGMNEPKVEVLEFVEYLKNPAKFKDIGARPPTGALLLGPPGCGKTLLAKALAAECEVPFYYAAGSEFINMIGGVGASKVRSLFKKARQSSPCIIYIDEIDAIGGKRSSSRNFSGEGDQTLNQLLTELDGMHARTDVIVLASTNRAEILDAALLRPGRFDRHIMIDLPTLKDRIELFELYLGKLKLKSPVSTYSTRLAQLTPGMSGADIANICNEAAIHAAREVKKEVSAQDFEYAIERVIAGAAKSSNKMTFGEKKVIAYHEAGHALVGWLLEYTDALLKVTIVPRTSNIAGFAQYLPKESSLYSQEQMFDMMCMALGGRVAESVIFNKISTGAQDDLKRVTKLAYSQIKVYGMSKNIGLLSFSLEEKSAVKPYSKQLQNMIDLEARQLVGEAYKRTEKVLKDNIDKLHQVAKLLLEKETISSAEIENLIGPPPFGRKTLIDPSAFYDNELSDTVSSVPQPDKQKPQEEKDVE